MSYHGIYINLDRSIDRHHAMDAELARVHLSRRYQRLRAAEGNALHLASSLANIGEIGCFLSHMWALKEGLDDDRHLHIVEDDTIFADCAEQTLEWAIASGAMDDFDILFTDVAMPLANESYQQFKSFFDHAVTRNEFGAITRVAFRMLDLQKIIFASASSYMVNKNSLHKLYRLYEDEFARGIRIPIDLFLRTQAQAGAIRIGCLFPFVTSVNVEETLTSTVRLVPDRTRRFTAANIGRYSFFIGCDWNTCQRLMDTYITQPLPGDRHAHLLTQLLAFSLMDEDKKLTA